MSNSKKLDELHADVRIVIRLIKKVDRCLAELDSVVREVAGAMGSLLIWVKRGPARGGEAKKRGSQD